MLSSERRRPALHNSPLNEIFPTRRSRNPSLIARPTALQSENGPSFFSSKDFASGLKSESSLPDVSSHRGLSYQVQAEGSLPNLPTLNHHRPAQGRVAEVIKNLFAKETGTKGRGRDEVALSGDGVNCPKKVFPQDFATVDDGPSRIGRRRRVLNVAQLRQLKTVKFQHKDNGLWVHVDVGDLEDLRDFFNELDVEGKGVLDMLALEDYTFRHHNSPSASITFAARFSRGGPVGFGLMKRLQKCCRSKKTLTLADVLKLAYPGANQNDILKLLRAVQEKSALEKELDPLGKLAELKQREEETSQWSDWFEQMWPYWDADGNGELDEFEFKTVVRDIGASAADADSFFEEIDVDRSGFISRQEFKDWWIGKGNCINAANFPSRTC